CGESLSTLINKRPIPIPQFLGLTRQICLGLQSAHQGIRVRGYEKPVSIIHRDIKPSNILITQDPTLGELAKILDFGIAKLIQADSEQTSSFMGTLAYASPEQMEGKELDNRSDIYSLGIMMFQMLTSKLPLRASSHTFGGWYKAHHTQPPQTFSQTETDITIPKLLEKLVMSCLEKQPQDRPQSISEILQALEPLEQRFGSAFRIGQRIGATLSRLPVVDKSTDGRVLPAAPPIEEDPYRLAMWPKDKPIAEIVFPQLLQQNDKKSITTLWVMLPPAEIVKRLQSTRYNNFICTMSPHPMALWLTVLYSAQYGPRWLPCYLDLKTQSGQEMTYLLGQVGTYKVLFFSKEEPGRCAHVVSCNISPPQQKLLKEWVLAARNYPSIGDPKMSKNMLRNELNTSMKEKILRQLESIYIN
ncbi:MAG: serine/threonine protein kinase, partial [Leptolyngbya sp. SIO1D8]|nr:serine/threonine protein kinase [Leptolyngbya sp. SIO1D8]